MKETFNTKKPKCTFLQKYIAYYYFHESTSDEEVIRFTYYPHIRNALTIYKNSLVILNEQYDSETIPSNTDYYFVYTKLTRKFGSATINAPFDKVGIVFQPLGLNYFLEGNLADYIFHPLNLDFSYFKESMKPYLDVIYSEVSLEEKVDCLDDYFNSIFIGFEEKRLEKAIQLILDTDHKYTVHSLAQKLEVNRKTLLRLFNKHLCCSVKDYLRVVNFRRALDIYTKANTKPRLTHLAFDADYYDQAEFIKHFTKLTGFNPKRFFNRLEQIGSEETLWSFE